MLRKSRKNVGLIGLGIIGSRVAAALRVSGFQVFVWSRTPRAEPNFLGSPSQVADLCDTIQIFVADAEALFETIDKLRDSLQSRHLIICSATVGPEATAEAARRVHERGARFLDAPFTGSKEAAEQCGLVYYVGGEDRDIDLARPVLEASSKDIIRMGDIGHAAAVKIATNMLVAVTVQTLAEAVALLNRSGINPSVLSTALRDHAASSRLIEMKLPKILQRDFEPHFSLKNMFKDVQLAIHMANSLDLDIPATTATAGVMYGGLNRGWGESDLAAIAQVYLGDAPPLAAEPPAESAPNETEPIRPAMPMEVSSARLAKLASTSADAAAAAQASGPASSTATAAEKSAQPKAAGSVAADRPNSSTARIVPDAPEAAVEVAAHAPERSGVRLRQSTSSTGPVKLPVRKAPFPKEVHSSNEPVASGQTPEPAEVAVADPKAPSTTIFRRLFGSR